MNIFRSIFLINYNKCIFKYFLSKILKNIANIAEEKCDSWITPGNLILGFEYPNREIGMVESDFYMWFPNQFFY